MIFLIKVFRYRENKRAINLVQNKIKTEMKNKIA